MKEGMMHFMSEQLGYFDELDPQIIVAPHGVPDHEVEGMADNMGAEGWSNGLSVHLPLLVIEREAGEAGTEHGCADDVALLDIAFLVPVSRVSGIVAAVVLP